MDSNHDKVIQIYSESVGIWRNSLKENQVKKNTAKNWLTKLLVEIYSPSGKYAVGEHLKGKRLANYTADNVGGTAEAFQLLCGDTMKSLHD